MTCPDTNPAPSLTRNDTVCAMSAGSPGPRHRDLGGPGGHVGVPVLPDPLGGRPGHVADDEPGSDAVGRDAEPAQLDGEGLREALQPGLRRGVVGLAAVAQRRRARHVDDPAPRRRHHVLLHRPGHQERPAQVHVHHDVPVQLRHPEQQVVPGDARVVDQHGGRAQLGLHAGHRRLDLLGVGHVGPERPGAPTRGHDRVHGRLRRGLLEVHDRDREPVRREPQRRGRADAAGRSGHDRHPRSGGRRVLSHGALLR